MKKIAIDGRMMGWTGIGVYTQQLLDNLQQLDHDNQYYVLLLKKDFRRWQPRAANFHKVLANYRPYSLGEQIGLAIKLYRLRPSFVHFLAFNHPLLYFGKKLTTIHDLTLIEHRNVKGSPLFYWFKYWGFRLILWHAIRNSKLLIVPTQFVKEQILRRFKLRPAKIYKIYLGVTKRSGAQPSQPPPVKDFLLYVGNAYPYKNLTRLVDAFGQLSPQYPHLQLVLGGRLDFFYQQLQRYVKEKSIRNVYFPGYLNDQQLGWLYNQARLFVFPSYSEGFGLPGLEAMAAGTPVVSARASCLPEVYQQAALYFEPADTPGLATVLGRALTNEGLRAKLIKEGRLQAAKFDWSQTARQTQALYQKV